MASQSFENSPTTADSSTQGQRGWYIMLSLLLLILLLVPWGNGIAPALSPSRFFRVLPFPAGNVLFAFYAGTILLNVWTAIAMPKQTRSNWYRFWLAVASMVMILLIADLNGLSLMWGAAASWIMLAIAAYSELVFLFSR